MKKTADCFLPVHTNQPILRYPPLSIAASWKVKTMPLNDDTLPPGTGGIGLRTEDECEDQDCGPCLLQFLPLRYFSAPHLLDDRNIPDDEAQISVQTFVDNAARDWHHIRDRLQLYGDALRSKWKKLSKVSRKALILQAQPDLYPYKSPEQRVMFKIEKPEKDGRIGILSNTLAQASALDLVPEDLSRQQRNAFLVPYLNI